MLNVDMTPSSFWITNPDNYVERNIAAGCTHYGFWFFPEPHIRGASENEPGASAVCPQGIPLLWWDNNEAHSNGRYGLRVHSPSRLGGFYPKERSSCADTSPSNLFVKAHFQRQFSWRNTKNGMTITSVAAFNLVDAIAADNCQRGIEMVGADGVAFGDGTRTKLRGWWESNKLLRPLIIGHDLPCPYCERSNSQVLFCRDDKGENTRDIDRYPLPVRMGLQSPAAQGLAVVNATFINYDRSGMIAVAGFPKAFPPAAYNFAGGGLLETSFRGTTWVESDFRVKWRWDNEALFKDLDGSFAEQSFCENCSVLNNAFVRNFRAFPECYHVRARPGAQNSRWCSAPVLTPTCSDTSLASDDRRIGDTTVWFASHSL